MIERIFKAYDIRGTYPDMINEDVAWKAGYGLSLYFQRSRQGGFAIKVRDEKTLVVGRDTRTHSQALQTAVIEGVRAAGYNVLDIGMVDTPMLYFAINHNDCVGGIQIIASHYSMNHNGFILCGPKARPIGSATGLEDVRRIMATLRVGRTGMQGQLQSADYWAEYRAHVLQFLNLERALKIVVDASNGMAGWMVPAVFELVPMLKIVPLHCDTGGEFIHEPNPAVIANLTHLRKKVLEEKADLGVCFDGDADRVALVDEKAQPIPADLITILIARRLLAIPANRSKPVIYDLRSSHVVPEQIQAAGGTAHRNRVGRSFVCQSMNDLSAIFGGECTGQYYFRDNFNSASGAIALAHILSILGTGGKGMSEMVDPLRRYHQSGELSFHAEDQDVRIRDLADKFRKGKVDYLDGITVEGQGWWFNVRKSTSEPVLRLNIEANSPELLQEKLTDVKAVLGESLASTTSP